MARNILASDWNTLGCPYCGMDERCKQVRRPAPVAPDCDAESPRHGLACTREEGHTGAHVACGIVYHEVKTWT